RSQIFNGREQSCVSAVGSRLPWNPAHVAACKVGDIVDSRQRQGPHEFLPEQGQGAVDTGFSAGSKAVKVRPSDRAGSGAKSTSLYDVRPAPDAAVADNVRTVPEHVAHRRDLVDWSRSAVELAAAMVRDHH